MLITDLITLKIDFNFENPNREKRWLRLLVLFLLSGDFYMSREIQKKYMKNRENNKPSHKSINTTIVLIVIGNPVPPCLFLTISYSFARFVLPFPSYQVIYHWPYGNLFYLWLISVTQDLSFFRSCLRSLRYSFLRLFVTSLFLIVVKDRILEEGSIEW